MTPATLTLTAMLADASAALIAAAHRIANGAAPASAAPLVRAGSAALARAAARAADTLAAPSDATTRSRRPVLAAATAALARAMTATRCHRTVNVELTAAADDLVRAMTTDILATPPAAAKLANSARLHLKAARDILALATVGNALAAPPTTVALSRTAAMARALTATTAARAELATIACATEAAASAAAHIANALVPPPISVVDIVRVRHVGGPRPLVPPLATALATATWRRHRLTRDATLARATAALARAVRTVRAGAITGARRRIADAGTALAIAARAAGNAGSIDRHSLAIAATAMTEAAVALPTSRHHCRAFIRKRMDFRLVYGSYSYRIGIALAASADAASTASAKLDDAAMADDRATTAAILAHALARALTAITAERTTT